MELKKKDLMAMVIELQADQIDRMHSEQVTIARHHQEMDALRAAIGIQNNLISDLQRDLKSLDNIAIDHARKIAELKGDDFTRGEHDL